MMSRRHSCDLDPRFRGGDQRRVPAHRRPPEVIPAQAGIQSYCPICFSRRLFL